MRFKLVLVIVISWLLVGCSSTNYEAQVDQTERIEIEFWYGLTGNQGLAMDSFIQTFNESQSLVTVIGVQQESYAVTAKALKSALVKKKSPQVVLLEDSEMHNIANRGGLYQLDDLIRASADFQPEDFIQAFYNQGIIDGEVYSIPIYGTTQIIYYRKDMFEEQNIPLYLLNTWEGIAQASERLTKKIDDETFVYGFEPMQGRENLIDAALNKGAKFISEDGKTVLINDAVWVETFERFRVWINEEKIMKVHFGGEGWQYWYATIDDVLQGRAAAYMGSVGDREDLDFDIVGTHVRPYWIGHRDNPTGVMNGHTICIPVSVTEAEAKAAFQWIEYITSELVSAKWAIQTGYIPVRTSSLESDVYREYLEEHPEFAVINDQLKSSTHIFVDPTRGVIYDVLKTAAEKVQVQNVSAQEALDEAQAIAQAALDKILESKESE